MTLDLALLAIVVGVSIGAGIGCVTLAFTRRRRPTRE